ncbi:MAG: nicotinamide-nucleotide amidase [Salibacteraceae bacterium]|jgi:nicotinamide-nucleotide amidase
MTKSLQILCISQKVTVAAAESCTGGNIAHEITKQSGSSNYFSGSVVSYSNEVKENVLGVFRADLVANGAVSEIVSIQMAEGVRELMSTNFSVSTTGIAGPTGAVKNKPIGTVWIAVSSANGSSAKCFIFKGNREEVIAQTTQKAIELLQEKIALEMVE